MQYIASDQFVTREIAGEVLAIPVGGMTRNLNGMITFSESGGFLWKLLAQEKTREALAQALADEYGVEPENVLDDVDAFLASAAERGMVRVME